MIYIGHMRGRETPSTTQDFTQKPQMTWFIQIQDKDGKVLLLNESVGNYKKYSKFVDNAADKIVAQFPTAHRWEVRPESFTSKVIL